MASFHTARSLVYAIASVYTSLFTGVIYLFSFLLLPLTKAIVGRLLRPAEIEPNGVNSWDPQVHDDRFYCCIATYGYTGVLDAYKNGYFETGDLKKLLLKLEQSKYYATFHLHPAVYLRNLLAYHFYTKFEDKNGKQEQPFTEGELAAKSGQKHNTFQVGYWKTAHSLDEAYTANFDLIAKKLKVKSGQRVLDIGCGEGALCKHLAQNYDVELIGVNTSKEEIKIAQKFCEGLNVVFKLIDPRHITGHYKAITAIQAIENFGQIDLRDFFEAVHRCLEDDGLFLFQTIAVNHTFVPTYDTYFDRSEKTKMIYPYYTELMKAIEGLFVVEDWQNLGHHGELHSRAYLLDLERNWDKLVNENGARTMRGTKASMAYFHGQMAQRHLQLYQIVFSKNGLKGGYETVV